MQEQFYATPHAPTPLTCVMRDIQSQQLNCITKLLLYPCSTSSVYAPAAAAAAARNQPESASQLPSTRHVSVQKPLQLLRLRTTSAPHSFKTCCCFQAGAGHKARRPQPLSPPRVGPPVCISSWSACWHPPAPCPCVAARCCVVPHATQCCTRLRAGGMIHEAPACDARNLWRGGWRAGRSQRFQHNNRCGNAARMSHVLDEQAAACGVVWLLCLQGQPHRA
jgi:hypothetical protein